MRTRLTHTGISISKLLFASILALASFGTYVSKIELREANAAHLERIPEQDPLYLPELEHVRAMTLGFDSLASNVLWFKTLSYFGKRAVEHKDVPWFSHMCNLVTELDGKARHAYEFCGTLLSWIAKEPKAAVAILDKAIENDPGYWRYYYLRGFTQWYFLEDKSQASKDLHLASKQINAPIFLVSLASRLMSAGDSPETAIRFLNELIRESKDSNERFALQEKLDLAIISKDLKALKLQADKYHQTKGNQPESLEHLVDEGLLRYVPKDPYGELYFIDTSGEILSKKGGEGLTFSGKTAKTGLAKW